MVMQLSLVLFLQFADLFSQSVVLFLKSLHLRMLTFSVMLLLYIIMFEGVLGLSAFS
jgi:hypothetical protein